jgi:hypothetical protein
MYEQRLILASNHTQSTTYIVGEIAAEKLITEYKLCESKAKLGSIL